jgi:hypothetical protein
VQMQLHRARQSAAKQPDRWLAIWERAHVQAGPGQRLVCIRWTHPLDIRPLEIRPLEIRSLEPISVVLLSQTE